jgi:WD40 repeat protein/serine/threonine protein kinase
MTPEHWHQVEEVFHHALELDSGQRVAFLDRYHGHDGLLRQQVLSLLQWKERPGSFLQRPAVDEAVRVLASDCDEPMLGQRIGPYEICARLGIGGMGEVYLARDGRLGRKVAIKVVPEAFLNSQDMNGLFHEAQAASSLNHPNIIIVHDVGQTDSAHFIVTEFIQGETLREKMRGRRLSIPEATDITIQVASGLTVAHHTGIVHRDIKPENIMLRDDGLIKLLDFGIAKLRDSVADIAPMSDSGATQVSALAWGTVGYMSPEQIQREPLDGRSDIFSTGVLLYEMVSGRRPFEGEDRAGVLRAILNEEPPPLRAYRQRLPPAFEDIVTKSLQKKPDDRFQSAAEMVDALKRLKDDLGTQQHGRRAGPVGCQTQGRHVADSPLLLARLFRRKSSKVTLASTDGKAFRGLLPFEEADRDTFYGRDTDVETLFKMVARPDFRFGVLHGGSGCGKTSLVGAGLLPRMRQAGYTAIYCRSYTNPLTALVEECRRTSSIERLHGEAVVDYLRRVTEGANGLVVICDQFEEFFVNGRTNREREPFTSFVAACHATPDLALKFLMVIRSDFLFLIGQEFDGRIPEPLMGAKRFQLQNFDEEQAEEIIWRSAMGASLPLDPRLCAQVARDLTVSEAVLPSELQILGVQLQRKGIFTINRYYGVGGKEALVYSFLDDVVQASGDREACGLLLRSLISDSDTRLTLPAHEIIRRTHLERDTVEALLQLLTDARLVREIQDEEPWRYELIHEYLIEKINQTTGRLMDARQRANRMLRQYLSGYAADRHARIPITKLYFVHRYSDLTKEERARRLLNESLRRGLVKVFVVALLLAGLATGTAAALSITEVWDEVILKDGHTRAVRKIAFSPDGRLLVSCGEDSKVMVWDFERREILAALSAHTDRVASAAFSPDGKWFATCGYDKTVILWDTATFEKAAILRGHEGPVYSVAFSPDARLLASASEAPDRRTILWSVGSWEKLREIPSGTGEVGVLLFSPDSRRLSTPCSDSLWDVETGRPQAGPGDLSCPGARALSPDGTRQVDADSESSIAFWDSTGIWRTRRRRALGIYRAHQDNARAVAFSPDGRLIATASDDVVLWDVATQTKVARFEHSSVAWSVAFSPDGRWLVTSHGDGSILVWDPMERLLVANLNQHSGPVRVVGFSPDGKRILSGSEDGSIIVWDTERLSKDLVFTVSTTRVCGASFSPDGQWLASCDQRGMGTICDLTHRDPRSVFQEKGWGGSRCLAVSPDGKWIAASRGVYDSSNGQRVFDFHTDQAEPNLYGVAFSQNGRRLVCASPDKDLAFLLDTRSWQVIDRLQTRAPVSVAFSPDGNRFVTGCDDGTVRLYETDPLREAGVIGRHSSRLKSVVFSPDGKRVASAGDDDLIALWDVGRRHLIGHVGTHTAPVLSVAFSPDGKRLVSGEHDKSVRLYTEHRTLWGHRLD